ncbi:TPA: hypothetical protein MDN77_003709 [Escherichia coli]|nr:hypothetical protein [Escherichia coli]
MMKKSLCCALLLTASFSTFAAAKTEQQIADISRFSAAFHNLAEILNQCLIFTCKCTVGRGYPT